MNRLILIGNGFDLAHGYKTAYNDFILWYLAYAMGTAFESEKYEDDLMQVEKTRFSLPLPSMSSCVDHVQHFYNLDRLESLFEPQIKPFKDGDMKVPNPFTITVHSKFLTSLISKCSYTRWVDIENFYYEALKDILKSNRANEREKELKALNSSLEILIKHLQLYLINIKPKRNDPKYSNILTQDLNPREFTKWDDIENKNLENTLVLNFNYTTTIEQYLTNIHPNEKFTTNHIHGDLFNKENPMIFGFGDELDEDYKTIEKETIKGFFTFIKSFWYFKTTNYHDLLRYIDSGQYQVFILGHSCGLSDRTMLNMIFEHKNCVSIKPYFYVDPSGKNNYTEITQEISRHFNSKAELRRKIVSLPYCSSMPQVSQY